MATILSDYGRALRGSSRNTRLVLYYYALISIAYGIHGVLLNLYLLKQGFDERFLGSMVLAQSVALSLLVIPLGLTADRTPKQRLVKIGWFLIGVPGVLVVLSRNAYILLATWAVQGLGFACASASEFPYLSENSPPEYRTHIFSITTAIFSAFPALGMLLGGYLPSILARLTGVTVESAESYRFALLVASAVFFSSGFAVLRLGASSAPATNPESRHRLSLRSLAIPAIAGIVLNTALQAGAAGSFSPFMNVILNVRFSLSSQQIGWVFLVQNGIVSLASLAAPHLCRKRGHLATIALWQALSIPAVLCMGFARALPAFLVGYLVRGVLMMMVEPVTSAAVMEAARPDERGLVHSVQDLFRNLSWGLGGRLGGTWLQARAYTVPMLTAGALYAAGTYIMLAAKQLGNAETHKERLKDPGRQSLE